MTSEKQKEHGSSSSEVQLTTATLEEQANRAMGIWQCIFCCKAATTPARGPEEAGTSPRSSEAQPYDARTLEEVLRVLASRVRKVNACNWSCDASEAWTGNDVRDQVLEELGMLQVELGAWLKVPRTQEASPPWLPDLLAVTRG